MKKKSLSYYFNKDCNIFFFLKERYVILRKKTRYFFLKLPHIYFYKLTNNYLNFFFLNYFHFISFFKHILQLYNKLSSFYYLRLKLKGLGYRIIHVSTYLIKIFFNRSNFFYVHIPKTILFRYKIRRLFFLSTKLIDLRLLMINILLLKKYIIYRLSGLFYTNQILILKPGKNKFR